MNPVVIVGVASLALGGVGGALWGGGLLLSSLPKLAAIMIGAGKVCMGAGMIGGGALGAVGGAVLASRVPVPGLG